VPTIFTGPVLDVGDVVGGGHQPLERSRRVGRHLAGNAQDHVGRATLALDLEVGAAELGVDRLLGFLFRAELEGCSYVRLERVLDLDLHLVIPL